MPHINASLYLASFHYQSPVNYYSTNSAAGDGVYVNMVEQLTSC